MLFNPLFQRHIVLASLTKEGRRPTPFIPIALLGLKSNALDEPEPKEKPRPGD